MDRNRIHVFFLSEQISHSCIYDQFMNTFQVYYRRPLCLDVQVVDDWSVKSLLRGGKNPEKKNFFYLEHAQKN